ncbi:MAG TPA: hypothetical protein VLG11_01020 [Candidatus Saccharimonadales bacterium]|nr:hypothetical protein [Candidatus Saccharimonadales bacterium]
MAELQVRECVSEDFPAIKQSLVEAGSYVEAQDGRERLESLIQAWPSSALVCTAGETFLGSVCLTDSIDDAMLLTRECVSGACDRQTAVAVMNALFDKCGEVAQARGHSSMTMFYDGYYENFQPWRQYGFGDPVRCSSYMRKLWTPDGQPAPKLGAEPSPFFTSAYNPMTDFGPLTSHLITANARVSMDTARNLHDYAERAPGAIVVERERGKQEIIAKMHIPPSPIPLFDRITVAPDYPDPAAAKAALFDHGAAFLRDSLGAEQAEVIGPRNLTPEQMAGFDEAWQLIRVSRPL